MQRDPGPGVTTLQINKNVRMFTDNLEIEKAKFDWMLYLLLLIKYLL